MEWAAAGFVITMIRTLSKGTIVGFLFAGLYYLMRGLKINRKARIYVGLATTAVLMGFWGLLEAYLDLYTARQQPGDTYRADLYLDAIARHRHGKAMAGTRFRFLSLGGSSVRKFSALACTQRVDPAAVRVRMVGILIVAGIYWTFYRQVRLSRNTGLKSLAMAMLILVLVRGLVDTDRFELCFPLWLMTMLSIALAKLLHSAVFIMSQQPSFSIVTPSFNQGAFIGEALLSVKNQHTAAWNTW